MYCIILFYRGIQKFAMEITKLRLKVNLAYCSTLMYIISTDTNVQNGTVTMRLV